MTHGKTSHVTYISSVNPNPPRVILVLSVVSYVQVVISQSPGSTSTYSFMMEWCTHFGNLVMVTKAVMII